MIASCNLPKIHTHLVNSIGDQRNSVSPLLYLATQKKALAIRPQTGGVQEPMAGG
jgi:hypothetical protein